MKDSCTRILLLGIIVSIKTGYSYNIEDNEDNFIVDYNKDLAGSPPLQDESLSSLPESLSLRDPQEVPFTRQTRAGYLFRTRKDPNKKDRMYLFRTKKADEGSSSAEEENARFDPEEVEEGSIPDRERREDSNFYFRTRKFDEGPVVPRGGYYFRTRKSNWMEPSPISMRGYFLRTRKDPGGDSSSAYWFRNRRGGEDDETSSPTLSMPNKRGYFFRTRKLTDWDNFERNLRGRSYFLRT